jgi:hypothetical protein
VAHYWIGSLDSEFESLVLTCRGAKSDVPKVAQSTVRLDTLRHNNSCDGFARYFSFASIPFGSL